MTNSLARATHGSLLRRPFVGCVITVVLLGIMALGALLAATVFITESPEALGVLLAALAVTGALSLIPFFGLRWLDRREPEPLWLTALAFLWGFMISTGYSLIFNEINDALFGRLPAVVVGAPVVEELAKGAGVLIIFLLLRSEFDNARDGIVYGGLVGAGFNCLEAALYAANGFMQDGFNGFFSQIATRFILFGFNGHLLYCAMIGLGLGIARQTTRPAWKILAPLLGLLAAIIAHAMWNSLGALTVGVGATVLTQISGGDPENPPLLAIWVSGLFATAITAWPFFLAGFIALRRNDRWERRVMAEQLASEIGTSVTPEEYAAITRDDRALTRDRRAQALFNAQAELAIRKWHVLADGHNPEADPIVAGWRAEIERARGTAA